MAATAAQLNAFLDDQGIVAADQAKLTGDQAAEVHDSTTVANAIDPAGQGVLNADNSVCTVFVPVTPPTVPPTFTVSSVAIAK